MQTLIQKDFYQIRRNRILALSFLAVLLMGIFSAKSYTLDIKSGAGAIGIFDAMVFDSTFVVILATLIASSLLGSEFKNRTVNHALYSGYTRTDIFLSKVITYLIVYNLLILVFPLAGCLRMIPTLGLGTTATEGMLHILKIIFYSIVLNSAMYSACLLIAFLCRDVAKTLALSTVYILSFALLMAYGKPAGLFDRVKILDAIPLIEIRYVVTENPAPRDLLLVALGALVLFACLTFLANAVFKRADLV